MKDLTTSWDLFVFMLQFVDTYPYVTWEKRAKLKDKCNHIVLLKDRFSFFKSIFKQNWHANIKWVVGWSILYEIPLLCFHRRFPGWAAADGL